MAKVSRTERFEKFEDVLVIISDVTSLCDEKLVKKAMQIRVICMPNMMFEADYVEAYEPVSLETRFVLDNEDNQLNTHVYNEQRLVFRKGNEALKLFNVQNTLDDKVTDTELVVEADHIYRWTDKEEGCKLCRIHTFMMDEEPKIRGWHLRETEDFLRLEAPDHTDVLDFKFTENGFAVRRNGNTKCWTL